MYYNFSIVSLMVEKRSVVMSIVRAELDDIECNALHDVLRKTRLRKQPLVHAIVRRYLELCQVNDAFMQLLVNDDAVIDNADIHASNMIFKVTNVDD